MTSSWKSTGDLARSMPSTTGSGAACLTDALRLSDLLTFFWGGGKSCNDTLEVMMPQEG